MTRVVIIYLGTNDKHFLSFFFNHKHFSSLVSTMPKERNQDEIRCTLLTIVINCSSIGRWWRSVGVRTGRYVAFGRYRQLGCGMWSTRCAWCLRQGVLLLGLDPTDH